MIMVRISSGIKGLDLILKGGFIKGRAYLIKGGPGTGKTLFGLHFLAEGARKGEKVVCILFDESEDEVKAQAEDFKIPVDSIEFVDKLTEVNILSQDIMFWDTDTKSEVFSFIQSIDDVTKDADRVFIDGIGVISDMVKDLALYRRILSTIMYKLSASGTTTLISAEAYKEVGREVISYIMSGEIVLDRIEKNGKILKVLRLLKFRGDAYVGDHYFEIKPKSLEVYPIIPYEPKKIWKREVISTGSRELDEMFKGGIVRGSYLIIAGKTGVGKTNLSLQILIENDRRGEKGIFYSFDEHEDVILERIQRIFGYEPKNLIVKECMDLSSIGEFYNTVVEDFKEYSPSVVVIDPINVLELYGISKEHIVDVISKLGRMLKSSGCLVIGVVETPEAVDVFHLTGYGISYFADYLLIGRHVEFEGELLKAIAVVKNRFGDHERTFRILDIKDGEGLKIGAPLKYYTGIIEGKFKRI